MMMISAIISKITVCRRKKVCKKAIKLIYDGEYEAAAKVLHKLGSHADDQKMCVNVVVDKLMNEGKYKAAIEAFHKLGTFLDASKMPASETPTSEMSMYARAQAEAESGNYLKEIRTLKMKLKIMSSVDNNGHFYGKVLLYIVEWHGNYCTFCITRFHAGTAEYAVLCLRTRSMSNGRGDEESRWESGHIGRERFRREKWEAAFYEQRPLLYAHEFEPRSESGPLAADAAEKVEVRAQEGVPSRNARVRRPTAHGAGRAETDAPE